jgi:hypothetical protein
MACTKEEPPKCIWSKIFRWANPPVLEMVYAQMTPSLEKSVKVHCISGKLGELVSDTNKCSIVPHNASQWDQLPLGEVHLK